MVRSTTRGMILLTAAMAAGGCSVNEPDLRRHPMRPFVRDAASPAGQTASPSPDLTSSTPSSDSSLRSLLALARLSERQGQTDQAHRLYNVVIERDPQNAVPHHRLGVMYAKEERFQDSDRHFSKAVELDPSNPQLLSDIGYSCYLQHRLLDAEEVLRRAAAIPNDDPAISNNLGLVLGDQGRYEESMIAFRREGDEAQVHANLAYVHVQRGELKKAKSNYNRALTLNEGLRPVAAAMVQLAEHERLHQRPPATTRLPPLDGPQPPQTAFLAPRENLPAPLPPLVNLPAPLPLLEDAPAPLPPQLVSAQTAMSHVGPRPALLPSQPIGARPNSPRNERLWPAVSKANTAVRPVSFEQSNPPIKAGVTIPAPRDAHFR